MAGGEGKGIKEIFVSRVFMIDFQSLSFPFNVIHVKINRDIEDI